MAFAYAIRKESQWYKPGSKEPYKLSRTRIDNYIKCQRCFWLEERYGVKKPDSFPLTLNIAVDALLKKEFDIHRDDKTPHPLMKSYGLKAVPFQHPKMDEWRANFTGVRFVHTPTNLLIFGAVDDIWINDKGELHVVDYKATSKADTPTLDGDLGAQYKRQMEVYQWLLRQNGFKVSDTGYFVYVNGRKDAKAFDAKLEFEVTLLPCEGNADWIEPILSEIKECLEREEAPERNPNCDYCAYREAAGKTLMKSAPQKKVPVSKKLALKKDEKTTQNALF